MRMQLVEDHIKRVLLERIEVGVENVGERRAPDPSRHGVFGRRRDQPIERHHTSEPAYRRRELALAQNAVELQTLPELVADMGRASFTMTLGCDTRGIDFDQPAGAHAWRRR
jgi:hypothetical protein